MAAYANASLAFALDYEDVVCYCIHAGPVTIPAALAVGEMLGSSGRELLIAIERGYERWNWGGTWLSQEGVRRFKNKWAAQDVPYRYYTQVNDMSVLERTPRELLEAYPGFYLVPFNELAGHGA